MLQELFLHLFDLSYTIHNPREGKIHVVLKNPCLIILLFVDISAGSNFMIMKLVSQSLPGSCQAETADLDRGEGGGETEQMTWGEQEAA